MSQFDSSIELSIIVPVGSRFADAEELYLDYKAGIESLGVTYELIFVLDGARKKFAEGLDRLAKRDEEFTVLRLTRPFGEATALMAGFEQSRGNRIVTLPAYFQVEHTAIGKLVAALESADMAVGRRNPRAGGGFEKLRRQAFHGLLAMVTHNKFHDLGCGARAFKRDVLQELQLYGDQHKFLAMLADRQGFRVSEIDVAQSPRDRFEGTYRPREYARGFLDIFTMFFLVRFTKKPLRFFGMFGVSMLGIGGFVILYVVAQRMFFDVALASRPALLLASLMVVLGLQLFAIGLLGELIIFTHAREIKDYKIDKVIEFEDGSEAGEGVESDSALERV
jgi:glycosyltransferase involved in cell wall biosynthesis